MFGVGLTHFSTNFSLMNFQSNTKLRKFENNHHPQLKSNVQSSKYKVIKVNNWDLFFAFSSQTTFISKLFCIFALGSGRNPD